MFEPYVKKLISKEVLSRFAQVKREMEKIPNVTLPSGDLLSCHMVCRLLSKRTGLEFRDGYLKYHFQHSWLVFDRYIIDTYPVGALDVPILFETEYGLPWGELYSEAKLEVTETDKFKRDMEFLFSLKGEPCGLNS